MPKGPLFKKLLAYLQQNYRSFHTPGHQQGRGSESLFRELGQQNFWRLDLTEVPGLDNLQAPQGCLRESQEAAAQLFGALQTFYLVNGSTVGLQAALLALNSPGGKVLVPRQAHISILHGLVLTGGWPILLPVKLIKNWGIPLGVSPQELAFWLAQESESELLCTVQPTYQGLGYQAAKLQKIVRQKGISHLVDEAHGGHLFFQEEGPLSFQKVGADVVVQSTHKTMAALTQASMLHVNKPELQIPLQQALSLLQTSSPSYLLLASLDSVQAQMKEAGVFLVRQAMALAEEFRWAIGQIPGYRLFPEEKLPEGVSYDPTKVLVSATSLGLSGWELASLLMKKGIVVEMSDYFSVLFLITWGHRRQDLQKASQALQEIAREEKRKPLALAVCPPALYEKPFALVLAPRAVYYSKRKYEKLENTLGRICGAPLTVYPPGIPCLWPGQLIRQEHLAYLQWALGHNLQLVGINEFREIMVVEE